MLRLNKAYWGQNVLSYNFNEEDDPKEIKHTSGDGPEAFLACCVPNLQLDALAIQLYCSYLKINTAQNKQGNQCGVQNKCHTPFDMGRHDEQLNNHHDNDLPNCGNKACSEGTIREPQKEATLANTQKQVRRVCQVIETTEI